MGRPTTPSIQSHNHARRIDAEQKTNATPLYSQVEALRHEVAMLKARLDRQDVAAAK
jgi:uncharacterized protein YceH (UPF0502 family)